MKKFLLLLITLAFSITSAAVAEIKPDKSCSVEDFITYVKAGEQCLAIQVSSRKTKAKTLVIYLHGAVSGGGPADYFSEFGTAKAVQQASSAKNSIGIVIMRPGYYTSDRRFSSGSNNNRRDTTTKYHNYTIAAGILRLKQHYGASQVIVVGHSAGAMSTAAIIGQFHGIIDTAILVSCGCDTKKWEQSKQRTRFKRVKRQNPMDFVKNVKTSVRVIAINGKADSNTRVSSTAPYIAELKARGVSASILIVPGAGHNFNGALKQETIKETVRAIKGG